jgi:hypothetical protein
MKQLLLVLLLLPSLLLAETGYRLVHPDGTVEFSDEPIPGGEEIILRDVPTIHMVPVTPLPATTEKAKEADKDSGSITITSPMPEQTLEFDEAGVNVSVSVTPGLRDGQKVVIYLDGSEAASGETTSYTVKDVYRGAHTLSSSVVSAGGSVLFSSQTVTFYIQQKSLLRKKP